MTMPWNRQTTDSSEPREFGDGDSLKLIPLWSIILAIVFFVGTQYWFNRTPPAHRRPGSLPAHLIMSYMTSAALASYVLLVGYVSRDVKRRNMSAPLWMLVVVVMPGGIGAVVYFLLRQPIMIRCPNCTTELTAGVHFCPQCRFQVAPVCGQCFRGVQITDAFCPQCGHDVAEDHSPARLRAYSDT
jgi:branched-subunit amino acid ABC-type transport system permease component